MPTLQCVSIGQVCKIVGGGTPSRNSPEFFDGHIPWASVKDFKQSVITKTAEFITEAAVAASATNIVPKGTVLLVSRVGLGKIAIAGVDLAINQDIKALTPREDVLPEYLYWFLLSKAEHFIRIGVGATVKGITLDDIKSVVMPLPALDEQRRVIDILSRAEGIVRLRREAQRRAAELVPAIFLDVFGDPVVNPKKWPVTDFGSFGALRLGKMLDKKKQTADIQLSYLRNINVQWNRIDVFDIFKMGFKQEEREKFLLKDGDVMICEGGEVGRAAIWRSQLGECYYQKALHRLTPNLNLVRSDFVVWLLWHLAKAGGLVGNASHATIPHLTGIQLSGLKVIAPSVDVQMKFEMLVRDAHSIEGQQAVAFHKASKMFGSLINRFFAT